MSASPALHTPPASGHLQDDGSGGLVFDEAPPSSRLRPLSGHRRRSGSVPCRRPRDHSRQMRADHTLQHDATTISSLSRRPAVSVPQIVVDDRSLQPTTGHEEALRSEDVDESPAAAFRPRCRTVSQDPTYRPPSLVLPCRKLSLSTSPSTSGTLCTGEFIRVLLQRTDAGRPTAVSRPQ